MAGLFHGHLVEYPQIRIDCFTTPRQPIPYPPSSVLPASSPSTVSGSSGGSSKSSVAGSLELDVFPPANLYLLTHAHSVRPSLSLVDLSMLRLGQSRRDISASPDVQSSAARTTPQDHLAGLASVEGGIRIVCSAEVRPSRSHFA